MIRPHWYPTKRLALTVRDTTKEEVALAQPT